MFIALIVVVGILAYAWIVYPAVMLALGRRKPLPPEGAAAVGSGGELPGVAILFSAHNEEAVILKRLENLAALDYPADRLHVFAGIDGGADHTAEIALEWARSHPNVHITISPENHGKTAMLKRLVGEVDQRLQTLDLGPKTDNEQSIEQTVRLTSSGPNVYGLGSKVSLLVFTDANTLFAPDAVRRLVAPFSDSNVGGVCGRLVFVGAEKKSEQKSQWTQRGEKCISAEGGKENSSLASFATSVHNSSAGTDEPIYWNLETRLKAVESSLDSCLGANGAIYAMRKELFWTAIPDSTIIDDFVLGMKVREQGFRMVFEPAAVATEDLPPAMQDEWRRRVRIGAGAFQALSLCRSCLSPRYRVFAWMFWSHKVLRWFTPHLAVVVVGLGGWLLSCHVLELLGGTKGSLSSTTQQLNNLTTLSLLVGVFLVALLIPPGRKALKLLFYFIVMQAALFVGFLRFCKGGLKGTWERTQRGE